MSRTANEHRPRLSSTYRNDRFQISNRAQPVSTESAQRTTYRAGDRSRSIRSSHRSQWQLLHQLFAVHSRLADSSLRIRSNCKQISVAAGPQQRFTCSGGARRKGRTFGCPRGNCGIQWRRGTDTIRRRKSARGLSARHSLDQQRSSRLEIPVPSKREPVRHLPSHIFHNARK